MNTDDRGHWTSASNAQADELCAGRHLAQQGIPEPEKDESAKFGSAIHDALAKQDSKDLTFEQREVYDACRKIEFATVDRYFGPATTELMVIPCMRETRRWSEWGELKHSGRLDVFHYLGKKALVLEYKTLAGEVRESPGNRQLRDQVVLLDDSLRREMQLIACAVVQPFATHNPDICEYNRQQIEQARQEMWHRVKKSNNPKSPRIPGELQCKFCRAKTVCKEWQTWAGTSLPPVTTSLLGVPIANWSPEQMAFYLDHRQTARQWLDAADDYILDRLKADSGSVPGWELVDGNTREIIIDVQEAFNRFRALGGTLEAFLKCIKPVKKELKSALSEVTGARGMALDKAMEQLTKGISEFKQNQPSIKRKD